MISPLFDTLAMFLFGAVVFVGSLIIFQRHRQSRKWPKTKGVILESKKHGINMHSSRTITYEKEVLIRYKYFVSKKPYESQNIYNVENDESKTKKNMELLEKYYRKKTITVYYNKDNPNESFLEFDSTIELYFYMSTGIIFIISAIFNSLQLF